LASERINPEYQKKQIAGEDERMNTSNLKSFDAKGERKTGIFGQIRALEERAK